MHKGLVLDFGTGRGQDAITSVVRSLLRLGPAADPAARYDAADRAVAEGMVDAEQRGHLYDLLDLPLPAALQPQSFFLQAATIDPAAANGFLTTSNGLELRVL